MALIESNPRQVTESSPQALFQAAAYPEAIATVMAARTGSQSSSRAIFIDKSRPRQLQETGKADIGIVMD